MSSQSKDSIALGKKLVAELGLDPSVDTLGRWMAHRLAELITTAEASQGKEREAKMAACSSAILEVWRHRHELTNSPRPFEDFEPIFRTLTALDPEQTHSPYYRHIRESASKDEDLGEVQKWLQLADSLDGTARSLIRHCIVSAVSETDDKSKEWVELSKHLVGDAEKDILIINILIQAAEDSTEESPDDRQLRRKIEILEKLDSFMGTAKEYAESLRQEIARQKKEN